MATFSRHILSGSTNGRGIPVLGATTSGGQLIHTAYTATGSAGDEIWLYAVQYGTTTGVTLTLRHGGATSADQIAITMAPGAGAVPLCPGFMLNGALESRAFASASNEISIHGWVNRVAS